MYCLFSPSSYEHQRVKIRTQKYYYVDKGPIKNIACQYSYCRIPLCQGASSSGEEVERDFLLHLNIINAIIVSSNY